MYTILYFCINNIVSNSWMKITIVFYFISYYIKYTILVALHKFNIFFILLFHEICDTNIIDSELHITEWYYQNLNCIYFVDNLIILIYI